MSPNDEVTLNQIIRIVDNGGSVIIKRGDKPDLVITSAQRDPDLVEIKMAAQRDPDVEIKLKPADQEAKNRIARLL